MIFLLLILLF